QQSAIVPSIFPPRFSGRFIARGIPAEHCRARCTLSIGNFRFSNGRNEGIKRQGESSFVVADGTGCGAIRQSARRADPAPSPLFPFPSSLLPFFSSSPHSKIKNRQSTMYTVARNASQLPIPICHLTFVI